MILSRVALLLAVALPTSAAPLFDDDIFSSLLNDSSSAVGLYKRQDKHDLRILALGASIVYGEGSSHGNGFREYLREQLRYEGYQVNMVGSRRAGNMRDNDVEATGGFTIDEVRDASRNSLRYNPNVVVMNVGSNDCARNVNPSGAHGRMESLINGLLSTPGWDRTTIILSTLIPNLDRGMEDCSQNTINAGYRRLVNDLRGQGKRVVLAEMNPPPPHPGAGFISAADMNDPTHPNDRGFRKMAYVFWQGIETAREEGKLQPPHNTGIQPAAPGCEKSYGDGIAVGALTQQGSGWDDGTYWHASQDKGIIFTIESDWDRNQWRFVRLFSRDRDDLVGYFTRADGSAAYGVWKNTGDYNQATFTKIEDMSVNDNCVPNGIRFIDINGDGLDDFVCIAQNGDAFASINQGNGDRNANRPPTWRHIGLWKQNEGYAQDRIVLADIDGDGRGDYCALDNGGNVLCWRNGWIHDTPEYWQYLGKRFDAKGMGDHRGVRFEDINGDGRDDWLWVGVDGATHIWTSARSCLQGREGDGLNVAWRAGVNAGTNTNPTHLGMGSFASSGLRDRIHFARIYGEPGAFGLLGRQDYVFMEHIEVGDGMHRFQMRVWKNQGNGGTKVKADGVKYCNMMGRNNGAIDYVWTWSTGKMVMYPNAGKSRISPGESWWGPVVDPIWTPPWSIERQDLYLADWDGDGACDIIWADSYNNNRIQVWRNKYKETGRWEWDHWTNPAPHLTCPERRGLGFHDIPLRFADLTGNGRADYICMEKDGRSHGWVHESNDGWSRVNQFKFSEAKDRANLRFADVNGDGRADMIWVDKFNGDGWVWYNDGRIPAGGSDFSWKKPSGPSYRGYRAGTCTYYPDMDGDGRADMHSILGTYDNQAETSLNECGGGDAAGDDSRPPVNQNLPVMPGIGEGGQGPGGSDDPVCNSAAGTWDHGLWEGYNMGTWVMDRARNYNNGGWPRDVAGVPRIFSEFNGNTRDRAYNWPAQCTDVNGVCSLENPTLNKAVCVANRERVLALWSMQNFAAFLQGFIRAIQIAVVDTHLSLTNMVDTFAKKPANEVSLNDAAWLCFVAGILTGIGAYVPGGGAAASNFAAGVLTAGSGMAGASGGVVSDPKFATFASLSTNLAALNTASREAVGSYFTRLVVTTPPDRNEQRGLELARLIEGGGFFDQDVSRTPDTNAFAKLIKAPMISELWNEQKVYVLRIPRNKVRVYWTNHVAGPAGRTYNWIYDPCNGEDGSSADHNSYRKSLPKQHLACGPDGTSYLIIRWDYTWTRAYGDFGIKDEEKLKQDWGFSRASIALAAETNQRLTGDYMPRTTNHLDRLFRDVNIAGNLHRDEIVNQLLQFNLPVCDLGQIETDTFHWDLNECVMGLDGIDTQSCINNIGIKNCPRTSLNGKRFPYG